MDDNREYQKVVADLPPHLDGEVVQMTFQLADGEFVRLALSRDIAKHLGTHLLLVAGQGQQTP